MTSEPELEIVMPLLPVRSRGGPFPDDAYICGFEMGLLDMQLGQMPTRDLPSRPIHVENRDQADLIAMRHGYLASFTETDVDGWVHLRIRRSRSERGQEA